MARRRQGKPRLSRMDAAVDAMARLGFAPQTVRKTVKALLREYGGDEAWPFIEEDSYKELIEALLREQEDQDGHYLEEVKDTDNRAIVGISGQVLDTYQHIAPIDTAPVDIAGPCGEVPQLAFLEPVHNSPDASKTPGISRNINTFVDETAVGIPSPEDTILSYAAVARPAKRRARNCSTVKPGWEHIFMNYPSRNLRDTIGGSGKPSKKQGAERLHDGIKSPTPASSSSPLLNIPTPLPTNTQRRTHCYGWIESDGDSDDSDTISSEPLPGKLGAKAASSPEHTKRVNFVLL